MAARIDRDDLEVDADSVLVLRNAGPLGGPGMPEWGMLPVPKKLLQAGRARHGAHLGCAHERHELRHAACCTSRPESFVGGPLALVQQRRPDRARRRRSASSNLKVSDDEAAEAQGGLEAPGAAIRARLRRDLRAARAPGRRGLRLRLPRRHGADPRAGDPLAMELPRNAFKHALKDGQAQIGLWSSLSLELQRRGHRRRRLRLDPARHGALAERPREPARAAAGGGALPGHARGARAVERHGGDEAHPRCRRAIAPRALRVDRGGSARARSPHTRYPPKGVRGVAGTTRATRFGRVKDYARARTRRSACSCRWRRRRRSTTSRRSAPSTASTACSSARPTCTPRWAMSARSPIRR